MRQPQICHMVRVSSYTHTHTNNHIYDQTQQYANIIYTTTHKKRKIIICNPNVNILLTGFFDFSKIFLSLPDDGCIKTSMKPVVTDKLHAIKYT